MQEANNEIATQIDAPATAQLPENLRQYVTLLHGGRYEMRLAHAVKEGTRDVTVIEGTRPRGRHVRGLRLTDMKTGDFFDLFERSSGTSSAIVDQLDVSDAMRVVTLMGFFMGSGLATGQT